MVEIETDEILYIFFNFQETTHLRAISLVWLLTPVAIMEPTSHSKVDTCFIGRP